MQFLRLARLCKHAPITMVLCLYVARWSVERASMLLLTCIVSSFSQIFGLAILAFESVQLRAWYQGVPKSTQRNQRYGCIYLERVILMRWFSCRLLQYWALEWHFTHISFLLFFFSFLVLFFLLNALDSKLPAVWLPPRSTLSICCKRTTYLSTPYCTVCMAVHAHMWV